MIGSLPNRLPLRASVRWATQGAVLGGLIFAAHRLQPPPGARLGFIIGYLVVAGVGAGLFFRLVRAWVERGALRLDVDGIWSLWPWTRGLAPWHQLDPVEPSGAGLSWTDAAGRRRRLDLRLGAPAGRARFLEGLRARHRQHTARRLRPLPGADLVMETDRLCLRPWREHELGIFQRAYTAPGQRAGQPLAPLSPRASRRAFERARAQRPDPWDWHLALEVRASSTVVGTVHVSLVECAAPELRLGYSVFELHRRRGYATEAVRAVVQRFGEQGGADYLWADVSADNIASVRVLEKGGFCAARSGSAPGPQTRRFREERIAFVSAVDLPRLISQG
jgi:RimJ/RimL family protein N-acetyltransferase